MNDNYMKYIELLNKILTDPNISLEKQEKELIKKLLKDCLNQTNFGKKTKEIFKTVIEANDDFRKLYLEMQSYSLLNNLYI